MLYLNAYVSDRVYGGPEEGGWWYDAGTPIASIPLISIREQGKSYYLTHNKDVTEVRLDNCKSCLGDGWVEAEDESTGDTYRKSCDCGEVPEDCLVVAKQIEQYRAMLADHADPRNHQTLVMAVERKMAEYYPPQRPRYE